MWQTFPEHTKNLTTASRESHFKSLSGLAHNRFQGPGFAGISVATVLSLVDVCLDPETTEYGAIGHLAAPANSEDAGGSAVPGRSGFQTHRRSGLHTVYTSREPVAQPEGRSDPGRGLTSHMRDWAAAGAETR